MRRLLCIKTVWLLLLLFSTLTTLAQNTRPLTGTVYDGEKKPLAGISVSVKGTSRGATSDAKGKFTLILRKDERSLVVSGVGYTEREIEVADTAQTITITLDRNLGSMDEIIVIGYGTTTRKDRTGSVGRVSVEDLQKAPVLSADQALAGRVAGVQVISADGQPGANAEVIVRGMGSVTQSSAPLYVIDGFPQEEANFNSINPADIESIEVLKDASSTAIYGARGSNGVVMITTKRGKSPKPALNYNGYTGFQTPIKLMKVLSPYEFVRLQNDANPMFANYVYFANGKTLEDYKNAEAIDWQDVLMVNNPSFQNHYISLSARQQKTAYTISGSYSGMEGLIVNSGFKRYQARITIDQDVTDQLKVGVNVNYARFKSWGQTPASQNTPPNSSANNANFNFMTNLWTYRPVLGSRANDIRFVYEDLLDDNTEEGGIPGGGGRVNPYVQAINEVNERFNSSLNANAYVSFRLLKSLTLRSTVGLNMNQNDGYRFNNSKTNAGSPLTSSGQLYGVNGSMNTGKSFSLLNENTISYDKSFSKSSRLSAVAGFTWQQFNNEDYGFSATNLPNESLGFRGLGQGTPFRVNSNSSLASMASFLGRVNYTWKNNYLFTASMRADGTSKFHPRNRWGYFPSGAFAWRFGNEKFMRRFSFIDDAKLRFSYGATGNNRVSDFAYMALLRANSGTGSGSYYSWNDQIVYNIVLESMSNENLKWETGLQADAGLELSMFGSRVNLELDYYNRVTQDLLLRATLPMSTGFGSAFMNIGQVRNYGLEVTLNTVNVKSKNFNWSSSFNISFNRNLLLSLANGEDAMVTFRSFDASVGNSPNYIARVGQPIAQFYGLVSDGMYQLDDYYALPNGTNGFFYTLKEGVTFLNVGRLPGNLANFVTNNGFITQPGTPKFKDINGDGRVDLDDYTVIGNPYPKHYGGLNNNFSYKNFDLNLFVQWSYGNQILNANRMRFEMSTAGSGFPTSLTAGLVNHNMFEAYQNRWTPENPSDKYPSINATTEALRQHSTRLIEDGSYIRLKTVQVGYNVPQRFIKRAKLNTVRIYIAAQNLLTLTRYSGTDPEVNLGGNNLSPGFDFSPYPRTRVYTFGLNVGL